MTPDDIAKARAVISAATRGEWFRLLTSNTHGHLVDCSTSKDYIAAHCKKADADFIASARTGWPQALTYAQDMKQHAQEWEEQHESLRQERDRLAMELSTLKRFSTDNEKDLWNKVSKSAAREKVLVEALAEAREKIASCNCKRPTKDVKQRFLAMIEKTEKCWNWIGSVSNTGYGSISVRNRPKAAHRVAYELFVGPIKKAHHIDHLCRNRRCVNPEHLEVVTPKENCRRGIGQGAVNAAKTHCAQGHPFSGDNLVIRFNGLRRCKICEDANRKRAKAKALAKLQAAEGGDK